MYPKAPSLTGSSAAVAGAMLLPKPNETPETMARFDRKDRRELRAPSLAGGKGGFGAVYAIELDAVKAIIRGKGRFFISIMVRSF